jgi:hypothetical protein
MELLQAGDFEGALARFLESRARFRSFANTANAAVCLEQLGRFDEALDMYRELVADFSSKFSEEERRSLVGLMAGLRKKVGTIDVSSNVEGTVVVDGRARGTLPLFAPISVLAGKHRVRVLKEGYASDDVEVELAEGGALSVELKLRPLTDVGRLVVAEASGKRGLEVVVDGAPVGQTPWKGVLSQGAHVVQLRSRDLGTAPTQVNVVVGQELEQSLRAEALGPELVLRPQPTSADVSIDGVGVGPGLWRGRLPRGAHAVSVTELGYLERRLTLADGEGGEKDVVLVVDRSHPRWPKEPSGSFHVGLFATGGLGSSTGADPEQSCGLGCSGGPATFGAAFVRGGYAFLNGWRLEGVAGAARFGRKVDRTLVDGNRGFESTDELVTQGPFVGLVGGRSFPAARRVALVPRLGVGVGFSSSRDRVSVDVVTALDRAPMTVDRTGASVRNNPVFVLPSLDAEVDLTVVKLVGGVMLPSVVNPGPTLPLGEAAADSRTAPCQPGEARCTRGTNLFATPIAYRASTFLALTVGVSRSF